MKFTCSQSSLNKAINTVSRAVSPKTTMPILRCLLLNVENGELKLTASDLDISIETKTLITDGEDGKAVVNAKLFGEIIRKLPNSLVRVELVNNSLNIKCLGSEFSVVTLNAEEFPSVAILDKQNSLKISGSALRKLIRKTSFAASIDEKKGILVGCLVNIKDDLIEMVSLDGFRLALAKEYSSFKGNASLIVPASSLEIIEKIISEDEGNDVISLIIDNKKIGIETEETYVIARLLDGEFIKYNDIIPKSYLTRVVVSRAELLSSIERASLFAREGKNNLIRVSIKESEINITSKSEEGNINEAVAAEVSGNELEIGFNSKYIIDVLKCVEDEEVAFEMSTATTACLIKPVEGEAYTYLVLPVRMLSN